LRQLRWGRGTVWRDCLRWVGCRKSRLGGGTERAPAGGGRRWSSRPSAPALTRYRRRAPPWRIVGWLPCAVRGRTPGLAQAAPPAPAGPDARPSAPTSSRKHIRPGGVTRRGGGQLRPIHAASSRTSSGSVGVGKVPAAAEDPAADQAPRAAQEAVRPGRVARPGGETRAPGRRAPAGAAVDLLPFLPGDESGDRRRAPPPPAPEAAASSSAWRARVAEPTGHALVGLRDPGLILTGSGGAAAQRTVRGVRAILEPRAATVAPERRPRKRRRSRAG